VLDQAGLLRWETQFTQLCLYLLVEQGQRVAHGGDQAMRLVDPPVTSLRQRRFLCHRLEVVEVLLQLDDDLRSAARKAGVQIEGVVDL
jgi:hypothetical protein